MPGNTELLTQSIVSLLLVLAVMIGLLYASKWFMQRRPRGGRRLRFIEAIALGSKEKLMIVEVDDRQMLLSVTSSQVQLISELEPEENVPTSGAASSTSSKFSETLQHTAVVTSSSQNTQQTEHLVGSEEQAETSQHKETP